MLNLISDAWIPVLHKDGSRSVIAPWQMADEGLTFPDWPRPDLNIACLELLIGLVFLAGPPLDVVDWRARRRPDPERLRAALAPFAPAFELMGDGPRFMQDREVLETSGSLSIAPATMLFIDSGGENTFKKNRDLFVKRNRYDHLDPATAAMALFTTQIYAYSDSSKHKSSLRDNGPLVTFIDPTNGNVREGLWSMIWANVPYGEPSDPGAKDLPWLRPTVVSGASGRVVYEPVGAIGAAYTCVPETFFSMPWRIRLISEGNEIIGFVRKDFGTEYDGWRHPLTPYRRQSAAEMFTALKATPGAGFFTNWLGVVFRDATSTGLRERARVLDLWEAGRSWDQAELLVAGWVMDRATATDFVFSRAPLIDLPEDQLEMLIGMIEAAEVYGFCLRDSLKSVIAAPVEDNAAPKDKRKQQSGMLNHLREAFYLRTQPLLEARLGALADPGTAEGWRVDLRGVAVEMFRDLALPGLAERDTRDQAEIVQAWRKLTAAFAGYDERGQKAFRVLGLPVPEKKGKAA